MKRILILTLFLPVLLCIFLMPSCKKEKADPFNDEAKQNYEAIVALQEQSVSVLQDYQSTMDSTAAVAAISQWYLSDPLVESAVQGRQGIAVVYKSGIWGGLLLDPMRVDEAGVSEMISGSDLSKKISGKNLKDLPSIRESIYLPASWSEFPVSNERQNSNWSDSFDKLGYSYAMTGEQSVDLNVLATMPDEHGVICMDSHGFAWPSPDEVSEVYFVTGEELSTASTQSYFEDILEHRIMLLNFKDKPAGKYAVSPGFIKKHNDFSKDTVLFFGGFCFSYLGTWPTLVESCAAGTYFGFDWAVRSDKCADWAIDLIDKMADKTSSVPWSAESWMTSSPVPKSYVNKDNRTIHILYEGYGGLTLWKPANQGNGTIVSTAPDGAPISTFGFTCTDYTLQCNPLGQLPENLGYYWEYGDGSNYYTVNDNMALFHHWSGPQSYPVKVTITDIATQNVIMELDTTVSFQYPDFLPAIKANSKFNVYFGPYNALQFTGNVVSFPGFDFNTDGYDIPLTWTDSSFSSQDTQNNDYETITIEGNVSSDGMLLRHCLLKKISQDQPDHELVLEISNLPILTLDPINCLNNYVLDNTGSSNQNYLPRVEYKEYDQNSGTWITITSVDWAISELMVQFSSN
jgi:hypothetical protein